MQLSDPVVIAKLPRPGVTSAGQTRFCQVYGIRNGQRKKRQEVCAAVDGNSVNIIEVVNGRNLASWPIPLDASAVAEPISERISAEDGTFVRRTWCVLQRSSSTFVQCFEQVKNGKGIEHTSKSFNLKRQSGSLVRIHSANTTGATALLTYSDGTILTIDQNRSSRTASILQDRSLEVKILDCQVLSPEEASNSILKSRQDIAAVLSSNTVILVAAYQIIGKPGLFYGVSAINDSTAEFSMNIDSLITHSLTLDGSSKRLQAYFANNCKQLRLASASQLSSLDITLRVPHKTFEQRIADGSHHSTLPATADLDAVVSNGEIQIHNTKYDSVLSTVPMTLTSLKRKRDSSVSAPVLVAYFAQIGRILLHNSHSILAVDIKNNTSSLKQSSQLISNILRGDELHRSPSATTPKYACSLGTTEQIENDLDWNIIANDLDSLAQQDDATDFTNRFFDAFKIGKASDLKSSKIGQDKLDFLLSKIFKLGPRKPESQQYALVIKLLDPKLFSWCAKSGLFDMYRIAKALAISPTSLDNNAVVEALVDFKPVQIDVLDSYIQRCPYLEAETIALTLLHLVRDVRAENQASTIMQITDKPDNSNQTSATTLQVTIDPSSTNASTSNTISKTIIRSLRRLALTGSQHSAAAFQQVSMTRSDLVAVIQILRQQLFQGGFYRVGGAAKYPSPSPSEPETEGPTSSQQLSLTAIVTLLDACINVIGPVGILGNSEDEEFMQRMIAELSSEVTSTSEAVQDSVRLQGLLRETLRYAESVERQPFEVRSKVEDPTRSTSAEGEIVTIYSEPISVDQATVSDSALPLSLKADEVELNKTRRGGQVRERSARERGMLRDRFRAPYSFERLIL